MANTYLNRKRKKKALQVLKYTFLMLYLVIVMFPFFWMVSTSLKGSQAEIYAFPVQYLPEKIDFVNYYNMLVKGNFLKYMMNSFLASMTAAVGSTLIAILAGYIISRFNFRMKTPLMLFFLVTQMIPSFIMLAPLYQMLSAADMTNSLWTLALLYTNMTIPFSVVTLSGFYDGVPNALEEAAQIDGCSYWKALWSVIVPLLLPGIAAVFIFAFINSWNELFMAVMFVDVDAFKTMTVGLNSLILKYDIKWGEMAAGTVLALVPTMCLFSFCQKYMIEGLTSGSVKG